MSKWSKKSPQRFWCFDIKWNVMGILIIILLLTSLLISIILFIVLFKNIFVRRQWLFKQSQGYQINHKWCSLTAMWALKTYVHFGQTMEEEEKVCLDNTSLLISRSWQRLLIIFPINGKSCCTITVMILLWFQHECMSGSISSKSISHCFRAVSFR